MVWQCCLTDFGLTIDLGNDMKRHEASSLKQMTPMYAPLESPSRESLGPGYDVWSLGCVFAEMASVSLGRTLDEFHTFIGLNASTNSSAITYSTAIDNTHAWLLALKSTAECEISQCMLELVRSMLNVEASMRPSARVKEELFSIIRRHNLHSTAQIKCDLCEPYPPETRTHGDCLTLYNSAADTATAAAGMPRSHREIYRDFRRFLDGIRRKGSRSPLSASHSSDDYYFPEAAIQSFFADAHRLRRLVQALLPSRFDDRLLRKNYAKVFSILLGLKRGPDLAYFLGKPGFSDRQLPFDNRDAFVGLVDDEGFFEEFYQYQWKFCAPKLEVSRAREWEPKRILPFEILDELGSGASGRTYLIMVDHEYNELHEGRQGFTPVRQMAHFTKQTTLISRYRITTIISSSRYLTPPMRQNIRKN